MEERKHIDRLYQEKFKDFEATPREAVWKNLSSRLQEKERKRNIIPIWYRIAGIAALLALFFNFGSSLFKTSTSPDASMVAREKDNFGEFNLATAEYNETMFRSSLILQALRLNTENRELRERLRIETKTEKENNAIFSNILKAPVAREFHQAEYSFKKISALLAENNNVIKETSEKPKLNLPLLPLEEDLLAEENIEKKPPVKRLSISPTAAPVYFDNLGNGNPIDARFANNPSKGEISMSYGLNIAYQISEKIKIRSGVSKVDLSYNTSDIAFTAAVNPTILSGVDYKGQVPNYRIENKAVRPFSNINASTEFNRASLASPATGFLNQRLGFIEIPVEIEYVLIDKKIGVNLIGGGSTLFLDNNMISLNAEDFSTNIGEANNLNNVSFSTNVGVGVDYKISPQFQVNLEPILKYQINTFNNTNIDSYYFGIYSGFSFKF